ncbi:MAG: hypothetical protein MJE77_29660 [Proteobacteria bacterium]|nr:hypothetical protein [Pseudomonadota bacterium]
MTSSWWADGIQLFPLGIAHLAGCAAQFDARLSVVLAESSASHSSLGDWLAR